MACIQAPEKGRRKGFEHSLLLHSLSASLEQCCRHSPQPLPPPSPGFNCFPGSGLNINCQCLGFFGRGRSPESFPGGSVVNNLPARTGDLGSIPGSGRSPGGGHGNPLQYSWLENPKDRGVQWATVHGVAQSQTRLSIQAQVSPDSGDRRALTRADWDFQGVHAPWEQLSTVLQWGLVDKHPSSFLSCRVTTLTPRVLQPDEALLVHSGDLMSQQLWASAPPCLTSHSSASASQSHLSNRPLAVPSVSHGLPLRKPK